MTKIIISFIVGAALAISVPALAWQVIGVTQGGTETAEVPLYGEVLVGNSTGTYDPVATSTLNINASDLIGFQSEYDAAHIATSTTPGNWTIGGFVEAPQISHPGAGATDAGRYYVFQDEFGDEFPYFVDDAGATFDLTGGGGGGCSTLDCLSDVEGNVYTTNFVLVSDGVDSFDAGLLSHTQLTDIGSNTHATIDTHLGNTSNPHTVTVAQLGAMDLTTNQTVVSGVKTFDVLPTSNNTCSGNDEFCNKGYIDAVGAGFNYKESVSAASTGNVATSSTQTVDGYAAQLNDRVLLKDQTNPVNNGCYTVESGDWVLCTDSDVDSEVDPGTAYFVANGTANGGTQWAIITSDPITPGVTAIELTQIGAPPTYFEGDGIRFSGGDTVHVDITENSALYFDGSNDLDVLVNNSLAANASGLAVATTSNFIWTGLNTWTDARPAMLNASTTNVGVLKVYNAADFDSTVNIDSTLTLANIIGLTQCLEVDASGNVSGSGAACGTGGGGASGGITATSTLDLDFHSSGNGVISWRMGNSEEELDDNATNGRIFADLTAAVNYRLIANVQSPSSAGGDINLQYSTDQSVWNAVDTGGAGETAVDAAGVIAGAWTNLVAGAKQEVYLRIVGKDGGNTNTTFSQVRVQFAESTGDGMNDWQVNGNGELTPTTTIAILTPTTLEVGTDLTVTGNDIIFGNAETISNAVNGTIALTATSVTASGDLTVSGGDITGANSVTIDLGESDIDAMTLTTDGVGNYDDVDLQIGGAEGNIRLGAVNTDGGVQIYTDTATFPHALNIRAEVNPDAADYEMFTVQSTGGAERFSVVHAATGYANQFYDSLAVGAVGDNSPTTVSVGLEGGAAGDLWVADDVEVGDDLYVVGQISVNVAVNDAHAITLPNTGSTSAGQQTGYGIAKGWEVYSDGRVKSDVEPLTFGLVEVLNLQPKSYKQHDSEFIDGELVIKEAYSEEIGFIAQEVFGIVPNAASPPSDEATGLWSMNYDKLIPVLVRAIQEQQAMIDNILAVNGKQAQNIDSMSQELKENEEIMNILLNNLDEAANGRYKIDIEQISPLIGKFELIK